MNGTGKNVILFRAKTGEVVGGFAVITKATLEVDFDFLRVASDIEALMCVDAHRFRFAWPAGAKENVSDCTGRAVIGAHLGGYSLCW